MDAEGDQQRPEEVPVMDNSETEPQESHTTADYSKYDPPPKPPSQWRRWAIWLGVVIVVFAALVAGYKLLQKEPDPKKLKPTTSQTTQPSITTPINTSTKNYASQNFALSFDYPQDWTVTDVGGGILIVKSPSVTLKDANGNDQKIIINFTIRNKTYALSEFDAGNAVAERDSTKVAYTKPTQSQRADTYVSFLRYAKSTTGIDEICVTGNSGYKGGQSIPKSDIAKVDPVVCLSFLNDVGNTKQPTHSITIASSTWDDPVVSGPLMNLFKSLVIT